MMVSIVATVDMGVAIVSTVGISMTIAMSIVSMSMSISIGMPIVSISLRLSCSSGFSISRPLAIVVSMSISIRVAIRVAMDGGDYRVVSIGMSMVAITISQMAIVGISLWLSISSGFSISRPLAIVVSMSIGIRVAMRVAMDGGDYRVVSIGMSMVAITISKMAIVGISLWLSI